jgi:xylulokinase
VGLREALLPEVVETFAERDRVTPEAAEATGLPIGLPVICGGGDTALAALALDLAPGRVSIAVNTGGTVCTVSNSARMRPAAGLHTLCYARPDQWLLMQPILVAGEALIWHARVCFGTPELPAGAINTLLAEAATAPPGSDGLLFLPTLSGERTDPQGLGAFIGLRLAHTRASLTRAVLEGVAFELRGALETVIERETAAEIICSGGGFRSALWRQIQADVLGRPVTVVDEDQHSAIGAAWVACRGVLGPDVPAPRLSGHLLPPDDGRRVTYETAYALFRRAHADTRPISHAISLASGS